MPNMNQSIIERVQTQDETVIAQLYDDYGAALYGVAHRIVGVHYLSEQVVQDTFVKIWKYGPYYDNNKGHLFSWMIKITRNTAIDVLRSSLYHSYRCTSTIDNVALGLKADQADPHLMDVRQIVAKLDDKYRIVVERIFFDGFSQKELSEELEIPVGTIKSRLYIAKRELRGLMGISRLSNR
jgi:RNA polymerase sigma factor (sigma-70 family)